MEAIARTIYATEDCNRILTENGYPELSFYDQSNQNMYLVDQDGLWSSAAATNYMSTILAQYSANNNNMIELVIANNDDMALGAISALQGAGYNKQGGKTIPVFGVDATEAAKSAVAEGSMIGTIKQDAEGMADAILKITTNLKNGEDKFSGIPSENVQGNWRVNIPYAEYTGEK
jgi:methyl-galactoside transport system substrate-binding protein